MGTEELATIGLAERAATIAFIAIATVVVIIQRRLMAFYRRRLRQAGHDPDSIDNINTSTFLAQLRTVSGIILPHWNCRENWATAVFIGFFGLKAWLEMVRVDADSAVVSAIAGANRVGRGHAFSWFVAASLGLATVTGAIEQLRFWLIARYRTRLTNYFHTRLFQGIAFYRASLFDEHVAPGTAISSYCHEFAEHFAELPYYFVLPFAEACASLYFLSKDAGSSRARAVVISTIASLVLLRTSSPPFGKMHAVTLEAEERFRLAHADVRAHSEQLALHGGGEFIRRKLNAMYLTVADSLNQVAVAKGYFSILQNAVSLGVWDLMPLMLAAHQVSRGTMTNREAMLQALLVQRPLVHKFHQSIEALIENIKEASHLFEFTDKLAEFDALLNQTHESMPNAVTNIGGAHHRFGTEDYVDMRPEDSIHLDLEEDEHGNAIETGSNRYVDLDSVTIETPAGVRLLSKLSLRVEEGCNWVILGPNGSGKTSILRVLAGLWQPTEGTVTLSEGVTLMFLPQQAFILPNATLFEQLTFPDSLDGPDGRRGTATPQDLAFAKAAMDAAFGEMIVQLLGGWDSPMCGFNGIEDFSYPWDSLSGGQQQKLAIARLIFRAQLLKRQGQSCFAMMDESTSQIDGESEEIIFAKLKAFDVTFVSITHRERVIAHHQEALVLIPQRKTFKIRHVRPEMPARTESGTDLVDW